ncbi:hypothetical protein BU24DRAFT_13033 [Aaosphaeria arxii CBS 175.79]|uniref:Uncharacterized protein n=1 Tax=Aaosphaeria arxii CBS 175.79 TaxID=1450172 RepID=A0A6A5Y632_9PLEO|nr:uncharacterized protein BU24DRAFT_13033 [Aaosphaeria arxii CBS 175.79]KAF2021012.1 hypothetical protein BU24DRAFT_13033 [Aaosphaeria arxii CBS 175.79]
MVAIAFSWSSGSSFLLGLAGRPSIKRVCRRAFEAPRRKLSVDLPLIALSPNTFRQQYTSVITFRHYHFRPVGSLTRQTSCTSTAQRALTAQSEEPLLCQLSTERLAPPAFNADDPPPPYSKVDTGQIKQKGFFTKVRRAMKLLFGGLKTLCLGALLVGILVNSDPVRLSPSERPFNHPAEGNPIADPQSDILA